MESVLNKVLQLFVYQSKPLELAPYQLAIVRKIVTLGAQEKVAILASTRAGKTFAVAVGILIRALLRNDRIAVISPRFAQTEALADVIRQLIHENEWLLREINEEMGFNRQKIFFKSGASIYLLSAFTPESLLGHGGNLIVVDEAVEIEDQVYIQYIRRMFTQTNSSFIAISTPHKKNWFYEFVQSLPSENVFRITAMEAIRAGRMSERDVEEARGLMTEDQFKSWYMAQFPEVDVSDSLFEISAVDACMRLEKVEAPPNSSVEFLAGIDVGRLRDSTVVSVVKVSYVKEEVLTPDRCAVELVDVLEIQNEDFTVQAQLITNFLEKFERIDTLTVDVYGLGIGLYDLVSLALPKNVLRIKRGYTTLEERKVAYTFLARLVNRKRIVLKGAERWRDQFRSYSVEQLPSGITIKKSEGMRDDFVDSLALAIAPLVSRVLSKSIQESDAVHLFTLPAFRFRFNPALK